MHKNLMGKLIKSNNVNRGEYTYIYFGNELVDIATTGGKRYTRNATFDEEINYIDYVIVVKSFRDIPEERRKFEANEKPEWCKRKTTNSTVYETNKVIKTYHYVTPKQIISGSLDGLNVRDYYIAGRALKGLKPGQFDSAMKSLSISTIKWENR